MKEGNTYRKYAFQAAGRIETKVHILTHPQGENGHGMLEELKVGLDCGEQERSP